MDPSLLACLEGFLESGLQILAGWLVGTGRLYRKSPVSGRFLPVGGISSPQEMLTWVSCILTEGALQQFELLATEVAKKQRRQNAWLTIATLASKAISELRAEGFSKIPSLRVSPLTHINCSASSKGRGLARITRSCGFRATPTAGCISPA